MTVAITHPYCWPYIRRGNERNIEELARYLTARGYQVTTVSTRPGRGAVEETEYGRRVLHAALGGPLLRRLRVQEPHTFFFSSWRTVAALRPDVVHSWYFLDGLAASYARRGAVVLQINGVPVPGYSCYRWFPPEAWAFREAARRADAVIVCSRFIGALAREAYGVEATVIPPPVTTERYTLGDGPPDGRPVFLAVADFGVRRKGLRVLVRAFHELSARLPGAVLRLAGNASGETRAAVLDGLPEATRSRIEFLGPQDSERIAELYRTSSVMVLPAMWEPSGTVLLEALSAGTPVVGARHGGIPEFVDSGTGVLFDPQTNDEETANHEGLAEAMLCGLALSRQAGIRARCRAWAERFSWPVLGPRIESVYRAARSN